jgi:hypothetical protein
MDFLLMEHINNYTIKAIYLREKKRLERYSPPTKILTHHSLFTRVHGVRLKVLLRVFVNFP